MDLQIEFEKNYHRIIGNASFRRLQDEIQVSPLDRSDFTHTRLTHSLEVSSLAKSLGQSISENICTIIKDKTFTPEHRAMMYDILQCAGLIHDIGNPPFDHFGETAAQDWFKKSLRRFTFRGRALAEILEPQVIQDFCHFEGNTQAFRVVIRLHSLADKHGMDLTKVFLGAIIKYPVSSPEIDKDSGDIWAKKMGYFHDDREDFQGTQISAGTLGKRHPLTFILKATDNIACKTTDIEDAVKKGYISYEHLLAESKAYKAGSQTGRYIQIVPWLEEEHRKAVGKRYDRPNLCAVQNWIISAQGQMVSGVMECSAGNYGSIMGGTCTSDLFAGTDVELLMEALGSTALRYVFSTRPILKLEIAIQTIFDLLLDRLVGAMIPYDTDLPITQVRKKLVSLIPDNHKMIYSMYTRNRDNAGRLHLRLLLVTGCTYGTTDTLAKDVYQELNGIQQTVKGKPGR